MHSRLQGGQGRWGTSQKRGEKKGGAQRARGGEAGRNNQIKQERALQKAGKGKRGGVGKKRMVCKKGPSGGGGGGRGRVLKGKISRTGEKWDGCAWRGGRARDGWEMWPNQIVSSKGAGDYFRDGFCAGEERAPGLPSSARG